MLFCVVSIFLSWGCAGAFNLVLTNKQTEQWQCKRRCTCLIFRLLGHVPETSPKCGARNSFTVLLVCVWSFENHLTAGKTMIENTMIAKSQEFTSNVFFFLNTPDIKAANCRVFFCFCCLRCYLWVSKARIGINNQNISNQEILESSCITRLQHLRCLVSTSKNTKRNGVWGFSANGN